MVKQWWAALIAASSVLAGGEWQNCFNGKNLNGWTVKVTGFETGQNPGNLFRVENGLLTVSYSDFPNNSFKDEFGHIFINRPFTNYHFKCEYRFLGDQFPGGPKWAHTNSGVMLSGQAPETMEKEQKFPTSLEFQFLAQNESGTRTTGSICTPGTYVDVNGKTIKQHVIKSRGTALPAGEWVQAEAIFKNGKVSHIINGKTVIEYSNPKFDDGTPLTYGWISLQAESHPIQFRNIQIKELD
ncbi:3-keto-disaccharide hydrolase [Pontiella agarivorans]|uniref:DUF1080 domain-containing protein n=1 Tax=Pontiella agarivorans TaxID=3038953 RepID=A0ABU5MZF0_9BACT|nr:DUF1080 domain-containing protein [Pontiella agarivorans]MDZ8119538.1 DUF1080 domain-containing protein [Pontiella agarivorans]